MNVERLRARALSKQVCDRCDCLDLRYVGDSMHCECGHGNYRHGEPSFTPAAILALLDRLDAAEGLLREVERLGIGGADNVTVAIGWDLWRRIQAWYVEAAPAPQP